MEGSRWPALCRSVPAGVLLAHHANRCGGSPLAMLWTPRDVSGARRIGQAATARELMSRHFAMPDERPQTLSELEIAQLDPSLRTLLFTDGTVTRTLEVQTLSPVRIEVVDQQPCEAPEAAARYLDLAADEDCVRRRI